MLQVFVTGKGISKEEFKQKVYLLRKYSSYCFQKSFSRFYICSLSTDIIVYKV
ncbi:hypothetical protein X975_00020, partial [Stegodyphus mimosarum]